MTVLLPWIGIPSIHRGISLLEEYPQNIVGSFWVMCGRGFDDRKVPDWWIDNVLEENQAEGIIKAFEQGLFKGKYKNPLYSGICIFIVANSSNPAHLSYVIEDLRMWEAEGIYLLRIMAKHNIPAHTEVTYPEAFLYYRYGSKNPTYQYLRETLDHWTVQVWEDYCSYLMSVHGKRMFYDYCKKINAVKDEVKATVEKGDKPLVLTEGETDPIYIKTALELLGEKEIVEKIDIEWVGTSISQGKSINTGDGGLNNTRDVLRSNPKFLTRKVLLLYDWDTNKSNENDELLKIRKIPQKKNRKFQKGIENLFDDHLYNDLFSDPLLREQFYTVKTVYSSYGEENKIQEFKKMKFCKYICEERRQAEDFKDFQIIVDFIKDCLGTVTF